MFGYNHIIRESWNNYVHEDDSITKLRYLEFVRDTYDKKLALLNNAEVKFSDDLFCGNASLRESKHIDNIL